MFSGPPVAAVACQTEAAAQHLARRRGSSWGTAEGIQSYLSCVFPGRPACEIAVFVSPFGRREHARLRNMAPWTRLQIERARALSRRKNAHRISVQFL